MARHSPLCGVVRRPQSSALITPDMTMWMSTRPFACLAGLLIFLGACGVDRTPRGTGSASGATPRPDSATAVASPETGGRAVPAFVTDSMPADDSAAAGDSAPASDTSSAIRSVYTSLAEKDCRVTETDDEVGGSTSRCPGTAGYALMVHDYDARMSVDVVPPRGRALPLRYSAVITSNFSALGPRAEWRMRGATPIALIVRVNANEDPAVPERTTSYLAVAKIASGTACVTDRIAPTVPNANLAAQQAADRSAARPCLRDLGEQ